MEPEDVLLAHAASGAGVLGDTHKDTARRIEEVRAAYVSLRSRLAEAAAGMEQAERERDEARADVLRFGRHDPLCFANRAAPGGVMGRCDCGYDDARKRAEGRTG